MLSDTLLQREGMRVLAENLGLVEAGRFIALMNREPFDYTKWQHGLFADLSLEELLARANQYQIENFGRS
ncbi:MAG: hypothetical protein LBE35_00235 [Clostridiales bacterium]|jgi:hypothetical protein|nr:hypothetical protein [Clostridiales bacterium]